MAEAAAVFGLNFPPVVDFVFSKIFPKLDPLSYQVVVDKLCCLCRQNNLRPLLFRFLRSEPQQPDNSTGSCGQYLISVSQLQTALDTACPWCWVIWRLLDDRGPADILRCNDAPGLVRVDLGFRKTVHHIIHYTASVHLVRTELDNDPLFVDKFNVSRTSHITLRPTENNQESFSYRLDRYRAWLEESMMNCAKNHIYCPKLKSGRMPPRVVDVSPLGSITGGSDDLVSLYEPNERQTDRYTTLSYCWGGENNLRLTNATYNDFMTSIPFRDLPAAFQDAVIFTRHLGIRYLWIDAICIVQDSEQDKRRQIRQMREIFSRAYITIVASQSRTVFQSFLRRPTLFHAIERSEDHPEDIYLHFPDAYYHSFEEPVTKRAWTFEERLLSRRVVIFTAKGVFWECQVDHIAYTPDPDAHHSHLPGYGQDRIVIPRNTQQSGRRWSRAKGQPGPFSEQIPKLWRKIVEIYSSRLLTHPDDRLLAISGIAAEFNRSWGKQLGAYYAGVWENDAVEQLLWYPGDKEGNFRETHNLPDLYEPPTRPQPQTWSAPSWSWASTNNPIIFCDDQLSSSPDTRKRDFKILKFNYDDAQDVSQDNRGECIRVLIEAGLFKTEQGMDLDTTCCLQRDKELFQVEWAIDPGRYLDQHEGLYLLPLLIPKDPVPGRDWSLWDAQGLYWRGLVIARVDASKYRRIGWLTKFSKLVTNDVSVQSADSTITSSEVSGDTRPLLVSKDEVTTSVTSEVLLI